MAAVSWPVRERVKKLLEAAFPSFLLGRAEAERTLSVLWDRLAAGEARGKGGYSAGKPLQGRGNEGPFSNSSCYAAACNFHAANTRSLVPTTTPRALLSFPIYLYSFLICVACRGPTPRRRAPFEYARALQSCRSSIVPRGTVRAVTTTAPRGYNLLRRYRPNRFSLVDILGECRNVSLGTIQGWFLLLWVRLVFSGFEVEDCFFYLILQKLVRGCSWRVSNGFYRISDILWSMRICFRSFFYFSFRLD